MSVADSITSSRQFEGATDLRVSLGPVRGVREKTDVDDNDDGSDGDADADDNDSDGGDDIDGNDDGSDGDDDADDNDSCDDVDDNDDGDHIQLAYGWRHPRGGKRA